MSVITRRTLLHTTLQGGAQVVAAASGLAAAAPATISRLNDAAPARMVDEWMADWMQPPAGSAKMPVGPLHITRFADPTYVLTQPIAWKPNANDQDEFQEVSVPKGFVTDFASIPQAFWSQLRPDGEYTYAAIVHDYLYWTQARPRVVADEILRLAMQDFPIDILTIWTIYGAVRVAGGFAWRNNAKLKAAGERRVLKRTPQDPTVTWQEWKKTADVFE
jgi:Protein of unknown function (DUF1353)